MDRFFWASPFYVFSSFIILFCLVPCGRLSWLLVSFWAHVNIVHHIIRWLSQVGRIVRGSFQETAPRKTAENTVRFDGSQWLWWRWKFSGRNNTTIFDNMDIGICRRRCSCRLWCYRFSMSDVYIGRTLGGCNLITAKFRRGDTLECCNKAARTQNKGERMCLWERSKTRQ